MIASEQAVALMVVLPLLSALVINMAGWFDRRLCFPIALFALLGSCCSAFITVSRVIKSGVIHYRLGGWAPPMGIEYVVDHLNALVLVIIFVVSLLALLFSYKSIQVELPEKILQFYTLYLLLVAGLAGMTITGDAFNLYVLMEISALTSYALIALGDKRALVASFNYIILGTIGASLYLLGVGHLYIMTGSLNMADLQTILPALLDARAIAVAFVLVMGGVWVKMAFFPMHGWLPNAYSYAPSSTSCLVAPLMTKVSVYIMIRMMFSVFNPNYIFVYLDWGRLVVPLATVAIIFGSISALAQKDLRKMLTYIIVAEVGYMVGGAWLANVTGLTGAIYHILADAMMTLCLFMVVGAIIYKLKDSSMDSMEFIFRRMPVTSVVFVIGAFAMIGIPPTCGFFSKWYLISGAIETSQWHYIFALLFSSLVNAFVFFRLFEIGFFGKKPADGHDHHAPEIAVSEAPVTMLVPMVLTALSLIAIGIYTNEIVTVLITKTLPVGL